MPECLSASTRPRRSCSRRWTRTRCAALLPSCARTAPSCRTEGRLQRAERVDGEEVWVFVVWCLRVGWWWGSSGSGEMRRQRLCVSVLGAGVWVGRGGGGSWGLRMAVCADCLRLPQGGGMESRWRGAAQQVQVASGVVNIMEQVRGAADHMPGGRAVWPGGLNRWGQLKVTRPPPDCRNAFAGAARGDAARVRVR